MQQAVLQVCRFHFNMVGQLKPALERACRNPAMQECAFRRLGRLGAGHRQGAFLDLDLDLGLGKTRDGHRDPVVGIAEALDIVGRIGRAVGITARHAVEHLYQPVEANGGTIEGGEIKRTHGKFSLRSNFTGCPPSTGRTVQVAHPL